MGKKKLILLGGGGHCKSCIDVIESTDEYEIVGILDVREKVGTNILGYDIIGTDEEVSRFPRDDFFFLVTVGQVKSALLRKQLYERLISTRKKPATIISAHALVSKYSAIGSGAIVMHGAKINAGATVGENCIVNTNANIEHDCKVGNHVHISTDAVLNGECEVGSESFIGSNSVLVQGVAVGASIVIGAGAIVSKTIISPGVYTGNPCRKIG